MGNPSAGDWTNSLESQLDYYRARAAEYDEWFERKGRYDRGPEANAAWFREAEVVRGELRSLQPFGEVVELAAGTGIWSRELLPGADSLTVVDGAEEMLAVHTLNVPDPSIQRIHADLFRWSPDRQYDLVAFGFWLSHVPKELFAGFFRLVSDCLRPGGRFFFVDSLYTETSTASDHELAPVESQFQRRRLNDGREFEIVKRFPPPETLRNDLRELGWDVDIRTTDTYFIYGWGTRKG
ncbi:MAG: class I SAM-dependent methyltransferase [Candidatus Eisenbacteria bacterium]|uniref:Class I SAM-dependent methyltransferase n=1 Tax=Eiseniibacteriota bacterium TaxID=2212470 RepID=A0A956SCD2_UNCEI|nr:class I SAM-dependent methyltransferase [Candidatus Eisenbacteria bacterium]MCB9465801.1 class I SAM-dependent methyltransferase [Candidatus Eisenbacteria bacterium]